MPGRNRTVPGGVSRKNHRPFTQKSSCKTERTSPTVRGFEIIFFPECLVVIRRTIQAIKSVQWISGIRLVLLHMPDPQSLVYVGVFGDKPNALFDYRDIVRVQQSTKDEISLVPALPWFQFLSRISSLFTADFLC